METPVREKCPNHRGETSLSRDRGTVEQGAHPPWHSSVTFVVITDEASSSGCVGGVPIEEKPAEEVV